METAARIEALEDRERIRELCADYCFLVDDERFDELVDGCFATDATCEFRATDGSLTPIVSTGREEVRGFFVRVLPTLLREMRHTVHNHRIRLEGDRAAGECYFELTACDAATGEPLVGAGRYLDRYLRVDGSWRFAERRASILYISPLAEGWARSRFPKALTGGPGPARPRSEP